MKPTRTNKTKKSTTKMVQMIARVDEHGNINLSGADKAKIPKEAMDLIRAGIKQKIDKRNKRYNNLIEAITSKHPTPTQQKMLTNSTPDNVTTAVSVYINRKVRDAIESVNTDTIITSFQKELARRNSTDERFTTAILTLKIILCEGMAESANNYITHISKQELIRTLKEITKHNGNKASRQETDAMIHALLNKIKQDTGKSYTPETLIAALETGAIGIGINTPPHKSPQSASHHHNSEDGEHDGAHKDLKVNKKWGDQEDPTYFG